jgi:hypothetical protein
LYTELLKNRYGVALSPEAKTSKKWSERMGDVFKRQGKPWDDATERDVKKAIALRVVQAPEGALLGACRDSFDALLRALEDRLNGMRNV